MSKKSIAPHLRPVIYEPDEIKIAVEKIEMSLRAFRLGQAKAAYEAIHRQLLESMPANGAENVDR